MSKRQKNTAIQEVCGRTASDFLTEVHRSGDAAGAKRLFRWQAFWESPWGGRIAWASMILAVAGGLRLMGLDIDMAAKLLGASTP